MKSHQEIFESMTINEASEVSYDELEPKQKSIVDALLKMTQGQISSILFGIHGVITTIKLKSQQGNYRMDSNELQTLLKLKIRWLEMEEGYIIVGH